MTQGQVNDNHVPMTRAEDALAVHGMDIGYAVSLTELAGGRLLMVAGKKFFTSPDGGLTWSDAFDPYFPYGLMVLPEP